ncbi:MAG: hypothetical protein DSY82_07490 [Flavobacteriia bacterium]|nr:MAG: hypothetical protein DSY82_07490 [Flavobacteriia bacterium]
MNDKKLDFNEFDPVSKKEWTDKAIADLKGADFNKKLVWKNLSKIDLPPFYSIEDEQFLLDKTGENKQQVINYRTVKVNSAKKANHLALKAIEEGMNGLIFEIKDAISARKLLKGIDLENIAVSFIIEKNEIDFIKDFIALVKERKTAPEKFKGYVDLRIIYKYVTTGNIDFHVFDKLVKIIKLTKDYPAFKAVSISGTVFSDSGANQVQEIAFTLNSLVFYIDELTERGVDIQEIFDDLHIELGIGSEFFVEIGKFRAFNSLLHKIAEKYGVTNFSYDLTARTSKWNKSVIDANTNMLRTTTEAMSAILGNADGIIVDPYDREMNKVSEFSNRIAGNTVHILKEESYFGKVSNPVDGSYYIEKVTAKLAKKALEIFKTIEAKGDFYECFEDGTIQQQIAEICLVKIKLLSQRRLVRVGVNKYPNLMEEVDISLFSGYDKSIRSRKSLLKPKRVSFEIEKIRKATEDLVQKTGKRPVVELTSFGNLAMRKARAGFAYDFMGVGGFKILQEKSYCCSEKAAQSAAVSESDIVVICSSDEDYKQEALNFVKDFRALNKKKILLLAGNPVDLEEVLIKAGLDGFIHVRSDLIQTLSDIQKRLKESLKPLEI